MPITAGVGRRFAVMSESPRSPHRFDDLVREHQAGLRAYIRALGAQDAWVDDLAQEVFLVAYRQLDEFDATADFGRWLRGIARNLVLNERRKTARRSRLLHVAITDALAQDAEDPAWPESALRQAIDVLHDCVAQLPERSRELLRRRYAENAGAAVLAGTFQLSATAVRQWLVRTRAAVRRCVGGKIGEAWL